MELKQPAGTLLQGYVAVSISQAELVRHVKKWIAADRGIYCQLTIHEAGNGKKVVNFVYSPAQGEDWEETGRTMRARLKEAFRDFDMSSLAPIILSLTPAHLG